jgi:hypothetical protein
MSNWQLANPRPHVSLLFWKIKSRLSAFSAVNLLSFATFASFAVKILR